MYITLAIITAMIFFYSLVAKGVEKTIISGPMVFVAIGVLVGAHGLGWLGETTTRAELRVFADLTLALILFIDAANADLGVLKRQFRIPSRMLVLGLPGVIALGFGFAVLLFDGLTLYEAAILATMLAATDAALGKAVITNAAVPARIREGLNVESGLNDGLCVPVLLFFYRTGLEHRGGPLGRVPRLDVDCRGIGDRDGRRFGFCCSGRHTSALVLEAGLGFQNLDPGHGTCAGIAQLRSRAEPAWQRLHRSIYRWTAVWLHGKRLDP